MPHTGDSTSPKPSWGPVAESAGEGPVLYGTVRDTHTMFLTAGVLVAE